MYCDDIRLGAVYAFLVPRFVSDAVYVDLKYDDVFVTLVTSSSFSTCILNANIVYVLILIWQCIFWLVVIYFISYYY